mmetsp:Transcript_285/g.764  ORF Transcript_285/g.764 Transcript_285/m.764 type:complete len:240 (+) Transcript_285:993-1712(+)
MFIFDEHGRTSHRGWGEPRPRRRRRRLPHRGRWRGASLRPMWRLRQGSVVEESAWRHGAALDPRKLLLVVASRLPQHTSHLLVLLVECARLGGPHLLLERADGPTLLLLLLLQCRRLPLPERLHRGTLLLQGHLVLQTLCRQALREEGLGACELHLPLLALCGDRLAKGGARGRMSGTLCSQRSLDCRNLCSRGAAAVSQAVFALPQLGAEDCAHGVLYPAHRKHEPLHLPRPIGCLSL